MLARFDFGATIWPAVNSVSGGLGGPSAGGELAFTARGRNSLLATLIASMVSSSAPIAAANRCNVSKSRYASSSEMPIVATCALTVPHAAHLFQVITVGQSEILGWRCDVPILVQARIRAARSSLVSDAVPCCSTIRRCWKERAGRTRLPHQSLLCFGSDRSRKCRSPW